MLYEVITRLKLEKIVFSGGVAKNSVLIKVLEKKLEKTLLVRNNFV